MTIKIVLTALMIVSVNCQLLSCCLGSLGDDLFDFMRTGITGRELAKPAKPQTNAQINRLGKPSLTSPGGGEKGNLGLVEEETPNTAQRLAAVLHYVITTEVE